MKQVVSEIRKRISLLGASIQYTFRAETAHLSNNWGSILSTIIYTSANIIFINVLYANVKTIAGYSHGQMLLFVFVGQVSWSLGWTVQGNISTLIDIVHDGSLDLILARPVPSLFYITFQQIKIFSLIRDGLPPLIILAFVVPWSTLHLSFFPAIAGLFICLCGMICSQTIHLFAALPVFWVGESSQILSLSNNIETNIGKTIPYEGFGKQVQLFFTIIIPYLISAGAATSVMLGKSPLLLTVSLVILVTGGILWVRQYLWHQALRAYSSASS